MELTIYVKDSTKDMDEIKSNSIDLIITSPPYWDLRDYNHPLQLGFGMSYGEYFQHLGNNLLECKRVLKEDGLAAFIVGDVRKSDNPKDRPHLYSIHSDITTFLCQNGMELYDHFIWEKTSTKSKNKKIMYGSVTKEYAYPPYLYGDMSTEYILIFRKPGLKRKLPGLALRSKEKIPKIDAQDWLKSVWSIEPAKHSNVHPALFPPELPKRLIKLYSLEGDIILDPFCGSGTTLKEAINQNRNAIGCEINYDYICSLINKYKMRRDGDKYFKQITSYSFSHL